MKQFIMKKYFWTDFRLFLSAQFSCFMLLYVSAGEYPRCVLTRKNTYSGPSENELRTYRPPDFSDRLSSRNDYQSRDDRPGYSYPPRPGSGSGSGSGPERSRPGRDEEYETGRTRQEPYGDYSGSYGYSPNRRPGSGYNRTGYPSPARSSRYNYTFPARDDNYAREDKYYSNRDLLDKAGEGPYPSRDGDGSRGRGQPESGEARTRDNCQLLTKDTKSSHADVPTTTASAILSTPVGDFILYCAQHPARTILSYPLHCDAQNGHSMGKEAVHTAIEHTCVDIRVVDDLNNLDKPRPFVIVLSRGENSAAYQVEYEAKSLRLLPCLHIFEYKYLTDMESVFLGDAGTMLALSNDNPDPSASYYETVAPVYLAKDGSLTICGFADVTNTRDLTSWRRAPGLIMLLYTQRRGQSRRSVIHLFEVKLRKGYCDVKRYKQQRTIGAATYNGARNTLCASQPYTLDQCLCGVEDIQVLTAPARYSTAHLAVALANSAWNDDSASCANEELLSSYNSNDKAFCCCSNANRYSFVIEYATPSESFDFLRRGKTAFQNLNGRQTSVTEITQLETEKCCPVFQTVSPVGDTELFTLEYNSNGDLEVYLFINHGLPPFAERSTYGYCDDNDLIVSYTLNSFQADNTIHHIRCNKEPENPPAYRQYRPKYRFFNGPGNNSAGYDDGSRFGTVGRAQNSPWYPPGVAQLIRPYGEPDYFDQRNYSAPQRLSVYPSFNRSAYSHTHTQPQPLPYPPLPPNPNPNQPPPPYWY